jgi:hypothetical protein
VSEQTVGVSEQTVDVSEQTMLTHLSDRAVVLKVRSAGAVGVREIIFDFVKKLEGKNIVFALLSILQNLLT